MIASIVKKELKSYLRSPMSFILMGLFAICTGWIFFNFLITYVENTQRLPLNMRKPLDFYSGVIFKFVANVNLIYLFIIPLISMKSFAQEWSSKTIEIYFKAPVSDFSLVMAKYLSTVIFALMIFSVSLLYPILLTFIGLEDFTFVYTSYISMILNIMAYCSLGIFVSSLTSNTITAGVMSFVGILFFWMISFGLNISSDYFLIENLKFLSLTTHFERMIRGIFSFSDLSYYASFIFLFLFLTKKKLESRKWGIK